MYACDVVGEKNWSAAETFMTKTIFFGDILATGRLRCFEDCGRTQTNCHLQHMTDLRYYVFSTQAPHRVFIIFKYTVAFCRHDFNAKTLQPHRV